MDENKQFGNSELLDDTISRRETVKAIRDAMLAWSSMPQWREDKIVDAVKALPPAQPERKKGHWIEVNDSYNRISGKCSVCGWESHMYEDDVVGMDFCPNCGARLDEKDGDDDRTKMTQMDDLISRREAIDMLKNRWKRTRNYEGIGDDIAEECELYLKQVPPVTPKQPGWIKVTPKTMPKVREWVLCQCRAGIMDVLRLTEDGDWNKNYPHAEYMGGFVIAWMPLPDPAKIEG